MTRKFIPIITLALIIGGLGGYFISQQFSGGEMTMEPASGKGDPLFYRNPMNPEVTSPVPAKDEMGMDYVPVYAGDQGTSGPAGTVVIDPATLQDIGVKTGKVARKAISYTIRAPGRVSYDESLLTRVNARTEGWVEELFVNRTGDYVPADTILLDLYSPQLVTSQQEYLLALKSYDEQKDSPFPDIRENAKRLVELARRRLELLAVPEHQIRELEQTRMVMERLHIHSPAPGTIISIGVREGQHITPSTVLYELADLSTVWVLADVFEHELPWLKEGAEASMTLDSLPGETFKGHVDYIYPFLNPKTRTASVRLIFKNPDLLLKPDSFSSVILEGAERKNALVVPSQAVIRTGTRNTVFVVAGEGRFEPRQVKLGVITDQGIEILEGLHEGEEVVTSGQFLIDSESKLNEAITKMSAPKDDMSGMDMGNEKKEDGHDH